MLSAERWKADIAQVVDQELKELLLETSHAIHSDPELAFREYHACERLTAILQEAGFQITRQAGGLETAFRADLAGHRPGPTVAVLAEYDALPDVGHGCGHNIIATSALGAALAIARCDRDFAGRLSVVGTPAEEAGGGKILLAEAGVLHDVEAAIMLHPATRNLVRRGSLAMSVVELIFHGKAAHAAGSPDLGVNALQAVIQTFVGLDAQRIHMRADARVHGIITEGGEAVNIIPSRSAARFSVRASDRAYQRHLVERLRRSADGAATATGCRLEWIEHRGYDNMVPNPTIAEAFARNMRALGLEVVEPVPGERMGSTDMGDVSQLLPAVHAYFAIGPETLPGHSLEFAAAAVGPSGDAAVINGAKALAMTAADLLAEADLLQSAQAEYRQMLESGQVAGWERWLAAGQQYQGAPV